MAKFILKTADGKFMSEIYYMTEKDFETLYPADAKKFDSKQEAENFLEEAGFNKNFVFVTELSE